MNRKELALKCVRIEAEGGSVREFLKDLGFVSPWGTWFRLQKEDLGRKDYQITDGRGDKMRKVTLEQKKKAVDIAMSGGDPLAYLKEIGSKQPSALWYAIKKALKEADPEKYELLAGSAAEPVTTCCAPARPSGVEVPDELPEDEEPVKPEVALTNKSEDLTMAIDETPHVESITKPLNYDGFEVTGLKTDYGRFQVNDYGYLFFGANANDKLEMPVEIWRKFAEDLPKVMEILGIA